MQPSSVIAWHTSVLQDILFIFFNPKFEKVIGFDDKYSKLSSYKFWVCGIHVINWFSYNAYVLFIEKEMILKEYNLLMNFLINNVVCLIFYNLNKIYTTFY